MTMIWVDIETTGLDEQQDLILEVGMVVTDNNLEKLAETSFVVGQSRSDLEIMEPIVREMHTKNGLIEEVLQSGWSRYAVDERLFAFLNANVPEGKGKVVAAGSNVSFDRRFLRKYMSVTERFFHYRSVDVSSVKELVKRWHPDYAAGLPPGKKAHRAISDIYDSIAELAYYKPLLED